MESIKGLANDLEKDLERLHIEEQVTPSQKALRSFLKGMYDTLALQFIKHPTWPCYLIMFYYFEQKFIDN